jgi:chaperone BCS1
VYKSWGTEWQPFGKPRLRRPLSSVILEAGAAESILADFAQFTQSRSW